MLSISSIANSEGYYENSPEKYYTVADDVKCYFEGRGSVELGLYGKEVTREIQSDLMKGILPTGETTKIFSPEKHRAGWDLTFSAPKSVSVLALVTDNKTLLQAHTNAVKTALNEIESFASVRNRVDDKYTIKQTNNILVACHTHDTSRELDPQLHTHCLVFNLTKNENDEWQALSSDRVNKAGFSENIYANKISFGNIYRQTLRNEIEALGYQTKDTGKNGLWEIDGVPTDEFSKRSKQINSLVDDNATSKQKEKATLKTRKVKTSTDRSLLKEKWENELKATGFDKDKFNELRDNNYKNSLQKEDIDYKEMNSTAVKKAIKILSDEKSQISYNELLNTSLSFSSMTKNVIQDIKNNIDIAIENKIIMPLDKEKGIFVTKINLDRESFLREKAQKISELKKEPLKSKIDTDDKGINSYFNKGEKIAIIEGKSNTKTLVDRISIINNASDKLEKQTFVIVDNKKLKNSFEQQGIKNVLTLKESEAVKFSENSLLIVPQAEKLNIKQTSQVLDTAIDKSSSIIFFNDKTNIRFGNSLKVLSDNGIKSYNFTYFNEDKTNVEVVSLKNIDSKHQKIVADYLEESKNNNNTLLLSDNAKERSLLNNEVRTQLINKNLLGNENVKIEVLKPIFLNEKNRIDIQNYKKGMIVEEWDYKNKKLNQKIINDVNLKSRTVFFSDKTSQKIDKMKNFSMFEKEYLSVSKNEKLIAVGAMNKGEIKAQQSFTIDKIKKNSLILKDNSGKKHSLSTKEPIKLNYNYASSSMNTINKDKTVFTLVNQNKINENNLNSLIRQGENVKIYTTLEHDKAEKKLRTYKNVNVVSADLKGNLYKTIESAINGRKNDLLNENQKALNLGVAVSAGSQVYFSVTKAIEKAYISEPNLSLASLKNEFKNMVENGSVILVGNDKAILQETYLQEKAIQETIAKGVNIADPLISKNELNQIDLSNLTDGQKKATETILTTSDQFIGIQGLAGVGKTTQVKSVINVLNENRKDITIVGLAPTHTAVAELNKVGVKAQTISSFLVDVKQDMEASKQIDFKNHLFIIDEASMIGNKNTAALYKVISEHGGRGIFSGDNKQLLSVDTGSSFAMQMNYTDLKFSVMDDIVRQNENLKPAIYSAIKNDIENSIKTIESIKDVVPRNSNFKLESNILDQDKLKNTKYSSLEELIAKDYASRTQEARAETLVVTQRNETKDKINDLIRQELKEIGAIAKDGIKINALSPLLLNEKELKTLSTYQNNKDSILLLNKNYYSIDKIEDNNLFIKDLKTNKISVFEPKNVSDFSDVSMYKNKELEFSLNDKIVFNKSNIDNNLLANKEWLIKNIKDNSKLELINSDKEIKIIDTKDLQNKHINHGYCYTDYGVQGKSSKYAIIHQISSKGKADGRSFYVGLSRAKEHVTLVTDNIKELTDNLKPIEDRKSAIQIYEKELKGLSHRNNDIANKYKVNLSEIIPNTINNIDSKIENLIKPINTKDELIDKTIIKQDASDVMSKANNFNESKTIDDNIKINAFNKLKEYNDNMPTIPRNEPNKDLVDKVMNEIKKEVNIPKTTEIDISKNVEK